jgi:putative oxidoreductase
MIDMKSLGLLVLRLIVGGLFVIHGYPKFFGGEGKGYALPDSTKESLGEGFVQQMEYGGLESVTGFMQSLGLPNPRAAAWALSLAEFGGGLALIFGYRTRPVATALAFSQVVAINKVEAENGLVGGYEFNLALAGAATALAIGGPGKISLDG